MKQSTLNISTAIMGLGLLTTLTVQADDLPVSTTRDTSATSAPASRSHKHKKRMSSNSSALSASSSAASANAAPVIPEIMNQEGSEPAGKPNTGTPDHVPGTTGTSGQ